MILLLDIGNTNIKIGVVQDDKITDTWRIATSYTKTADEFGIILYDLFRTRKYSFKDFDGIIISSVAPTLNYTIEHVCHFYLNIKPIIVSSKLKSNLKFDYSNNQELGADRIVNAVAAYEKYGAPVITVDFGTATTFGVINEDGTFLGGAIAPGIKSSMEALVNTASKLPRIELLTPKNVVGKTTIENMQSGIIFGFIGLVDNLINEIKEETGLHNAKVIATGGMSQLVTSAKKAVIDQVDRFLSLEGLKILYNMNK